MSYAETVLATVPAAPPARKNQRATSCPAPISAKAPYLPRSMLTANAFWCVAKGSWSIALELTRALCSSQEFVGRDGEACQAIRPRSGVALAAGQKPTLLCPDGVI